MKTTAIVFSVLAVLGCCIMVLLMAIFSVGFFAYQRAMPLSPSTPFISSNSTPIAPPTAQATDTAVPIQEDSGDAGLETLAALAAAHVPENDPIGLAKRLGGVTIDIPLTVPAPSSPLTVGTETDFWATDTDTNEEFQVSAVLEYITPHSYFWVEDGVSFDPDELQALAEDFENHMYPVVRSFFGSEWTPGIDNDPHIYILLAEGLGSGIAGYFSSTDELHPLAHERSNAHEMFFLNADNVFLDDPFTYGVLAHEFQHMIQWNVDRNEESWVNEGMAEVAALLTGYYGGGFDYDYAFDPDIPLIAWPDSGRKTPHYGGAFLYFAYFLERFGEDMTRQLASAPENGLAAVDAVLAELADNDPLRGRVPNGDDLFQDFAAAMFLLDPGVGDGRYALSVHPEAPDLSDTETVSTCPTGLEQRDVNQFGIDTIRIRCQGSYTLLFEGSPAVPLLPVKPYAGTYAFWSNRGDESDMTLSREFDFTAHSGPLTLEYRTWFELEEDFDYVYVLASTDGEDWDILHVPSGTTSNPTGANYGQGYNGDSGGWILETVDLSAYAGLRVTLRFEYITDAAVNGEGFLLDEIAVPEAGYSSGFEDGDGGWEALGFVRVSGLLPQTFRVSLIEIGSGGVEVSILEPDAQNRISVEIEIGGEVDEALLVVSATSRYSRQKAGYTFDIR